MNPLRSIRLSPLATLLAAAILVAWCLCAFVLDQSITAVQTSRSLMLLGAVNGEVLQGHEVWRLISSQFLHVRFLHMFVNALCTFVVGGFIESRYGWWRLALIYFVGGSMGQAASVVAYPELVSSGASQALMSLCGAVIVMSVARHQRLFAVTIVALQVALDIYVAREIKIGHSFGFGGGLVIGCALLLLLRSGLTQSSNTRLERSRGA